MGTFRDVLLDIRAGLLARMAEEGFTDWDTGEVRHDPTPRDINHGWCGDFGDEVVERFPEAETFWLDELGVPGEASAHRVVVWEGRWYDAECLDGVAPADVLTLPLFRD